MPRELDGLRIEVAELRASRRRLAVGIDADRRSIERALHEGVQQQLVGLAANLELAAGSLDADPVTTRRLIDEMGRDVQRTLEETRELANAIYPPLLEAGGLVQALRSAAVIANLPTRIDVAAGTGCPAEIASAVYFCWLGVLRHAVAGTSVAVTVRTEGGALTFEIVADCDLDAEPLPRDRVEALGGRLTIRSRSGRRTRVTGSLPLPA